MINSKKIYTLLLICSVFLLLTGCQERYTVERQFETDYYSGIKLDLEGSTRDISVENWDNDFIHVVTQINGYGETQKEARRIAEGTEIDFDYSKSNNSLVIRSIVPDKGSRTGAVVSYSLKMPEDFSADIKNSTGDIKLENVVGDLNLRSSTGDIETGTVRGDVDINISTGDVYLEEVFGSLNLEGSTGDVVFDYLEGKVNIDVSTGDIEGKLDLTAGYNSITSSTGDISLNFTNRSSIYFQVETSTGDISVNRLGMELYQIEDDVIEGRIGEGRADLIIETSTGDINLIGN